MTFHIYDEKDKSARRGARVGGISSTSGGTARDERARWQSRAEDAERELEALREESTMIASVLEIRRDRMSISPGGGILDVRAVKGARVGDRVRCHRNTMAVLEVIRDEIPSGTIAVVSRQDGILVEAELLGQTRVFCAPPGMKLARGERAIVDSFVMGYVLGTLGMPPQMFARADGGAGAAIEWDDIGGQAEAKEALRESIELPFSHPHLFAAYGKRTVRGVLLSGPAGCGKTLLAKAAATAIRKAHGVKQGDGFVYVKGPELLNAFIGRSEEAIRRMFTAAREHKEKHGYPAVVFLDECDALLGGRDRSPNVGINATTVPQFLAEMDGLDDHAAMFILATNRPDTLDPAVVRDGRVDRKIRIERPTKADARQIFAIHLAERPIDPAAGDRDGLIAAACAELYDKSERRIVRALPTGHDPLVLADFVSGAMIAGILERATTAAMLRDISNGKQNAGGITLADLRGAIDLAQRGLRDTSHQEAIAERLERTSSTVTA